MDLSRRALLAGAAAALTPGAANAADAPNVLTEAMAGTQTPGMAALVIRNFRPEREITAGVRSLGSPGAVARGDRWHLGSDGKAITATLCARLVEQGALGWDRQLSDMLPQFRETMHESYRDVTLADLVTHRSGLPENISTMEVFNTFYDATDPLPAQRLRYADACLREAPAAEKRSTYSYSNTGYLIAGAICEQTAEVAYENLLRREVFQPLHMRGVSYANTGGAGEPTGHIEGRVADQMRDPNPPMFAPCGGMRMSLRDWSRFCIEHMKGEHGRSRLLSATTFRYLHTAQDGARSAPGWGAQPTAVGRRGPALTHAGSDGNWYALVVLYPEVGDGMLVTANCGESMGGDAACINVLRALAPRVSAPSETPPPQP